MALTREHGWARSDSGLLIPPDALPPRRPVAIDLFAGAGGFSLGFHQAGWHVAAAVELDSAASATYLTNLGGPATMLHIGPGVNPLASEGWRHERAATAAPEAGRGWISEHPDETPVAHFYQADIRHLTGKRILTDLGVGRGDVDCVIGGPPCQGFSIAGRRNVHDPRNSLVFEFARLCVEIQPKTFVMENVPGIATMRTPEGIPVLDALALYLSDGGMGTYDALRKALAGVDATAIAKPIGGHKPARNAAVTTQPPEALALFDLPARPQASTTHGPNATRGPRR